MKHQENSTSSAPVAIVTGGNSGIGEAIARMLGGRGYTVVVAGRRSAENERVAATISDAGPGRGIAFETDISDEADCMRLIETTCGSQGRLDLLVNNAGIMRKGPLVESSSEDFDLVMRTNLYATFWCSREAFRYMQDQATDDPFALRGGIINIASLCGVDAWAGTGTYSASKHGVMGLTRAAADEGADKRIRVAAICPAMVATAMTDASGPEYIDPEDIATTVAYLLDLSSAAWPTEIVVPRRGAG